MAQHNWKPLVTAIQQLFADLNRDGGPDQLVIVADIEAMIDAIEGLDPIIPLAPLNALRFSLPKVMEPTARDWSGFFAAFSAFLAQILPLVIPLFAQPKSA